MQELTMNEIEQVNGAFLANVGMGIAGSAAGMGAYSLAGGISGNGLSGCGFVGAGIGGFIGGFVGGGYGGALGGTVGGSFAERFCRSML